MVFTTPEVYEGIPICVEVINEVGHRKVVWKPFSHTVILFSSCTPVKECRARLLGKKEEIRMTLQFSIVKSETVIRQKTKQYKNSY